MSAPAVNLEDIGAPAAAPALPQDPNVIPVLAQPIPIAGGGAAPFELPPRVAATAPPPATAAPNPFQQPFEPIPIDPGGHATAGHSGSHPEAHAIAIRARAHAAAAGGAPLAVTPGVTGDSVPVDATSQPNTSEPLPEPSPQARAMMLGSEMVQNAEEKARIDAESKGRLAKEKQRQVDEQITLQHQHDTAIAEAERRRDEARVGAQAFKFQDHFEGHTGRRVIAAIGLALGGDPAILDRKIKMEFTRQEIELKRRQEAASESTRDVASLREAHREEWQNLKFRQGAALDAVAAKLEQEAAASNGRIDVTQAKVLAQKYRQEAANQDLKTQHDIAAIHLLKAQAAHTYAQAAKERALGGAGSSKAQIAQDKELNKELNTLEATTRRETVGNPGRLGFVAQLEKIQATRESLQQALRSGDPSQLRAATDAVKEAIGPTLSGGRTTQFLGQTITDSKTLSDKLEEFKGKLTGSPAAGRAYGEQLVRLIGQGEATAIKEVQGARQRLVDRTLGPGGMAATPAAKARAINLHDTLFGNVKDQSGRPMFGTGGQSAAPAPAAAVPPEIIAKAQKALADPAAPAAVKTKAQQILQGAGL